MSAQDRVDSTGDPLPRGAIARLGTLRLRHDDAVVAVAFSPDGKHALTASLDGTARVWSVSTSREVLRLRDGAAVGTAVYAPDGKTIVTGNWNGMIRVWDAEKGKTLRSLAGHKELVY